MNVFPPIFLVFLLYLETFFFFFFLFRADPIAYGRYQAKGQIRATAVGPVPQAQQQHRIQAPIPQLTTLEPLSTDRGQGSNPCPHGY